ncbi:OmpH family outer membrane protein [Flavobacterium zepuense]|uniref:OmpH family outer membrane protein n=1 Tax=Flavobacterium zepuense TaxID=2593302 RepID=A0A552UUJ6_9FLAO|nr:OmpH family outer membrane protein [Flavobacterium zepuense]TRW21913.1 OmpH family outer membrane protein [Flavobacterium zepuense]
MKQLKSLLIAALLFAGISQTANAQAKVAHINVSDLMTNMPEMKAADAQLKKLTATYDTEYNSMVEEFRKKVAQYEKESSTVTDAVNETRSKEVQDFQKRIQDYQQNATKELQGKQEAIYKPIMEKSRAAIQKVAKAKGYQYVLDSTTGSGLLLADGPDLLADVKKELGF